MIAQLPCASTLMQVCTRASASASASVSPAYQLHRILPTKTDPLVSLMMVEKVPDSTYEMVGGLDKQIKEIKEVIELRASTVYLIHLHASPDKTSHAPQPSSTPSCSRRSALRNQRVSCCTGPQEQARRSSPAQSRTTRTASSSASLGPSSCKSTLAKARAWSASSLSWPGSTRPASSSWTRLTRSARAGERAGPEEATRRSRGQCSNC